MSKVCKSCGILNENPLLPFCKKCYYEIKPYEKQQKPIKQVSEKRTQRFLNGGSEKEVFRKILIDRQDEDGNLTCEISGEKFSISEAKPWCFAHILRKSSHPHLRLFENNICLVKGIEEHGLVDKYVTGNKLEIEKKILNGQKIIILDYKK